MKPPGVEIPDHDLSALYADTDIAAIIAGYEDEIARAGSLLHDEIGQSLSAIGLQLAALHLDFREVAPSVGERTREIQSMLERAITHVRALNLAMDRSAVQRAGLRFSLERLVERVQRESGSQITLEIRHSVKVTGWTAATLYRIAAHAVEIAAGSERQITIRLEPLEDAYVLEVLYDVSSPDWLSCLDDPARRSLLLLHYFAVGAGVPVRVDRLDDRRVMIRATVTGAGVTGSPDARR